MSVRNFLGSVLATSVHYNHLVLCSLLISIIIPTLNEERSLPGLLDGIHHLEISFGGETTLSVKILAWLGSPAPQYALR